MTAQIPDRPAWRAAGFDARSFHSVVLYLTVAGASERPLVAVRVLSALFALLPAGSNELPVGRARVALEARCAPRDASRALSDLVRLGVLTRCGGAARAIRYAFDPTFAARPAPAAPQSDSHRRVLEAAAMQKRAVEEYLSSQRRLEEKAGE